MTSGRFPVVKTLMDAIPYLRTGKGVGIDMTGKSEEEQREIRVALDEHKTGSAHRTAVVCNETLDENWPVDSGDFAAHGTGSCLEGETACGKVLVVAPVLPKLQIPLNVSIGGTWENKDAPVS